MRCQARFALSVRSRSRCLGLVLPSVTREQASALAVTARAGSRRNVVRSQITHCVIFALAVVLVTRDFSFVLPVCAYGVDVARTAVVDI